MQIFGGFWRNNPSVKPKSDILESFESLLWSWIDFFYGFCDVEVPCQRITFAENFKSFERLKYTGTPTDVWKSSYLITTHDYLGYLFTMSLSWLQVVAFKEQTPGFERESVVRPMIQYLRSALGDRSFQSAMTDMEASLCEASNPQRKLIKYQLIQLQSILIALAVLEGTTTIQAINSLDVSVGATSLTSMLRSEEKTSWSFWDYSEEDYPRLLTLAGLGLPPSDCDNSGTTACALELIKEWIQLALEGLGMKDLSGALGLWSRLRSTASFVGVLNILWSSWSWRLLRSGAVEG